jgi:hypothetical protein
MVTLHVRHVNFQLQPVIGDTLHDEHVLSGWKLQPYMFETRLNSLARSSCKGWHSSQRRGPSKVLKQLVAHSWPPSPCHRIYIHFHHTHRLHVMQRRSWVYVMPWRSCNWRSSARWLVIVSVSASTGVCTAAKSARHANFEDTVIMTIHMSSWIIICSVSCVEPALLRIQMASRVILRNLVLLFSCMSVEVDAHFPLIPVPPHVFTWSCSLVYRGFVGFWKRWVKEMMAGCTTAATLLLWLLKTLP